MSRFNDKRFGLRRHARCSYRECRSSLSARQCYIREQIVEDLPSGLTLQFEAFEGGVRLTIASKALPANREIVFDTEGAASKTGASKRAFRRPSWLH